MWITCGYAVDNFLSGSKSVFFSRVSAVKTEEQKTSFFVTALDGAVVSKSRCRCGGTVLLFRR